MNDIDEELVKLLFPIIQYIHLNYNPHTSIIIDATGARVVEDLLSMPYEYNSKRR